MPHHPAAPVSSDWSGYVVVMDPSRSEIANRLNIVIRKLCTQSKHPMMEELKWKLLTAKENPLLNRVRNRIQMES